ncbi:hypothetical protein [Amycolatopsis thermoflava]|uniref:hypothetical protein n=1 Tax=Amycolatopsis thermoflava TaxID=84480 RepID=UPI0004020726|nr:hypothetical protein [Amycolatopsis thermoflava]
MKRRKVLMDELTAMTARYLQAEDRIDALLIELGRALEAERRTKGVFRLMLEPAREGSCEKVRLWNRSEAERFARLVEREAKTGEGALEPYRCPICPRQPIDFAHFWHIRHADPTKRGKGAKQYAKRRGLKQGFSPADLARLVSRLEAR